MQHNTAFRAMNTSVDIIVESSGMPPIDLFVSVQLLFEEQEQRFSRFRDMSLLSALNRGEEVADARFAQACRMALDAFDFTGGLFNPMVLPALAEAGYDRSFETVAAGGAPRQQAIADPRECLALEGDRVSLSGSQLDLGGIIKGWTVDLAVTMFAGRYPDVFVNAGGDMRGEGAEEGYDGWLVTVERPGGGGSYWEGVIHGAMATSTSRKRRWQTAAGAEAHHLIDPRTGLPADSPFIQVTAWAPEVWVAEVWAKAVLIGGAQAVEAAQGAGIRTLTLSASGDSVHSAT
jgi:FAD:protein FMN transferase